MEQHELEQTLVLIKPDALKVSLTGYILSQFSEFHTGLRFAAMKVVHVSRALAEEHYAEHREKPFFPALIEYLTGKAHYANEPHKRRVIAIVYSGPDVVRTVREIAGPTNPPVARDNAPGTIRALGTVVPVKDAAGNPAGERLDNLVHASATAVEAEREIKLWFKPSDIMPYMRAYAVDRCDGYFHYKDGRLLAEPSAGSRCLLAPGAAAWRSDLEALRLLIQKRPALCTLDAVVAKYLINESTDQE